MLADMGAEVIKVETADGETMRTRPPVRNGCSNRVRSAQCRQEKLGARSEVVPTAAEVIRKLVANVDILLENFRPGVMRRLKLDHETLRALNPKLVYCSISGYGQNRPRRRKLSGLCAGHPRGVGVRLWRI